MPGTGAAGGDLPPEHGISVLYDCFLLIQRLRPVLARALDGAPLRGDEYAVYSLLAEQGPLSPTVLARRTGMPATTVSDHVRSMTDRGHLTREPHPQDGRAAVLRLTTSGPGGLAGDVRAVLGRRGAGGARPGTAGGTGPRGAGPAHGGPGRGRRRAGGDGRRHEP